MAYPKYAMERVDSRRGWAARTLLVCVPTCTAPFLFEKFPHMLHLGVYVLCALIHGDCVRRADLPSISYLHLYCIYSCTWHLVVHERYRKFLRVVRNSFDMRKYVCFLGTTFQVYCVVYFRCFSIEYPSIFVLYFSVCARALVQSWSASHLVLCLYTHGTHVFWYVFHSACHCVRIPIYLYAFYHCESIPLCIYLCPFIFMMHVNVYAYRCIQLHTNVIASAYYFAFNLYVLAYAFNCVCVLFYIVSIPVSSLSLPTTPVESERMLVDISSLPTRRETNTRSKYVQ